MRSSRRLTTHKRNTNLVHLFCGIVTVFVLFVWAFGPKLLGVTVTDAAPILQMVAWVEITNLAQYAGKSAYDHKNGIFDTVLQNVSSDITSGAAQVVSEILQTDKGEAS